MTRILKYIVNTCESCVMYELVSIASMLFKKLRNTADN